MKNCIASALGFALITFAAVPAVAQNQTWIRQIGTSSNDEAFASAQDGLGGVYASGATSGSLGGPNSGAGTDDAWLAHYDGAGSQTWIRQFGTSSDDFTTAAAPDGAGGVYVSGHTNGSLGGPNAGSWDVWLAHYNSAGNQTWIRQFGSIGDDYVHAAALDGSGGVFVCGGTWGDLGGQNAGGVDAWLAHYDSAGNRTWLRQLGTSSNDSAFASAPDGSGGVYVSGPTSGSLGGPNAGGSTDDAWLAHFDIAGNQTWIRQFGTSSDDFTRAAAAAGSGGVYVSGVSDGSLGGPSAGSRDAWVAHYDIAGNLSWIRQFGTGGYEYATAAAPDNSGGVCVSGYTNGSLGGPSAGGYDAWLAHYDSAGNQTWIRQFGTSNDDGAYAPAPDGSGGVYVSGLTSGSLGGPNAGNVDAWLAHYDGPCPVPLTYCTAKINSLGCVPAIGCTGASSATATSGFNVNCAPVRNNKPGILIYSVTGRTALLFQGGYLCVGNPIRRSPAVASGGAAFPTNDCSGQYSIDVNAFAAGIYGGSPLAALRVPGTVVDCQWWGRDMGAPFASSLSDALEYSVCP